MVGAIGPGLLALIGAGQGDGAAAATWIAKKIAELRIFEDEEGKMNLSVTDTVGAVLVVSQFTLYGNCRKGRRPSFVGALAPDPARELVELVATDLEARGLEVARGRFGAHMDVRLLNDGPVTLILDSP